MRRLLQTLFLLLLLPLLRGAVITGVSAASLLLCPAWGGLWGCFAFFFLPFIYLFIFLEIGQKLCLSPWGLQL